MTRDGRLPPTAAAVLPFRGPADVPLREAALGLLLLATASGSFLGLTYRVWRSAT